MKKDEMIITAQETVKDLVRLQELINHDSPDWRGAIDVMADIQDQVEELVQSVVDRDPTY